MEYILSLINWKYVFIYVLVINVIGFLAMGIDKLKAKKDWWRIPEGTLMMLCLLGGGIGTICGMYKFRHKTKKLKFTVGMPTILILEITIVLYVVFKYIVLV